jgi:cellulose synthase (UDP-forming)
MLTLFPGIFGYLLSLSAVLLLAPILPWELPAFRALAASTVIYFNFKYLSWRIFETLPTPGWNPAFVWAVLVLVAEFVATAQVSLHTVLFIRQSDRKPEADELEAVLRAKDHLPSVDVFIPTVNEGIKIVGPAIQAALDIDWPNVRVSVLDDGRRAWLRQYCVEQGVNYVTRLTSKGFKAGNINHGLACTDADFILSVDADFVCYPNILYRTIGFMQNEKIALVQTPGNLTNPDPVQFNLLGERAWPEEQRVFTDIVQPSRDVWDNAFCYGGTFLVRRSALEAIGGIPEESITEDLYSSYLLRAKGYTVRYLNESLSDGLAAESLSSFIKQRTRWALGTMQCLYLEGGPFRASGLSLLDRLFFLDTVVFYLSFFWPLMILLAPTVYWWTGIPPFNAAVGHLLTMLVPRMVVSMLVMYWLTNRRVVPIVSELGRIVSIFHIIPAILTGIFDPFGHKFEVTLKGELRSTFSVQWGAMRGFMIVGAVTVLGMAVNLFSHGFHWLIWDPNMPQVLAFTIFDLWLLFFAAMICIERPSGKDPRAIKGVTSGNVILAVRALARRMLW